MRNTKQIIRLWRRKREKGETGMKQTGKIKNLLKKCRILLVVIIMAGITGCGLSETVSVEDDLVQFVNDRLPDIQQNEIQAMKLYNSYFDAKGTLDTKEFLKELDATILPLYKQFMEDLNGIKPQTEEVMALYELYYEAMDLQLQAVTSVEKALTDGNEDYRNEAEELRRSSASKYEEYQTELEKLAKQYQVTIIK